MALTTHHIFQSGTDHMILCFNFRQSSRNFFITRHIVSNSSLPKSCFNYPEVRMIPLCTTFPVSNFHAVFCALTSVEAHKAFLLYAASTSRISYRICVLTFQKVRMIFYHTPHFRHVPVTRVCVLTSVKAYAAFLPHTT